jgi:hypothetical protein
MSNRTDKMFLVLTGLFVAGLAIVAGAISFAHMTELAVVRSSWPGVPGDLCVHVVGMSTTGRAVCFAGRLPSAAGINLNHAERGDHNAQNHDR